MKFLNVHKEAVIVCQFILLLLCVAIIIFSSSYVVLNSVTLLFLLLNVFFTWLYTKKGLHVGFLFQITLLIFQGGRLISYALLPSQVWVSDLFDAGQTLQPETIKQFLIILCMCSYVSYIVFVLRSPFSIKQPIVISADVFLWIFFLTLPFYLYKNIFYIKYLLDHGGYIAIYLNEGEHLKEVGWLVRAIAGFSFSAYILYFTHEQNLKRLRMIMLLFLLIFSVELFVGLRGKYFTMVLLNFIFYAKKTGKGFQLKFLIIFLIVAIAISWFIAAFRENYTLEVSNPVADFFYVQGNSSIVSLLSIEQYERFHPHAWNYLYYQLLAPFINPSNTPPGSFFANDLSYYLNPLAYEAGFGTGSSFIAELYLMNGIISVFIGMLLISFVLSALNGLTQGLPGAISFSVLIGMVYIPRAPLLEALATFIKYGIPCIILYAIVYFLNGLYVSKKIEPQ